jgi:acetyl-CoA carboxylase biotin carboxylase subunit
MVARVLIANRGEIALRILRACRTLGIEAVVAYSEADRSSLPAMLADEAICIGPPDARRSYLSAPALISAALVTGCDSIHPGYGFLSEDDAFADAVREHGLTFIGPSAQVLERFASKEETRRLLAQHGLPTIPGSGLLGDDAMALEEAERIGYPVLVKPSAGGGGKGMRMVRSPRELAGILPICRSEAKAAFGDDSLYLERWLEDNRHVEIQVAVDRFGHGVHLWERDCSVQRRHQKILEESPSPAMTAAGRQELAERAVRAIVAAGYENVGTLEFLVDNDGNAYFIEINCRIQVEHPVTEMLTGLDMVALQIRIASGEPLGITQADVAQRGHAIEFRINAEDAEHDFRPATGTIERFNAPGGPGVRFDSHAYAGYEVPPYYDSLLGKLVVWGATREAAIARGRAALGELVLDGVVTNAPIHRALLASEPFLEGRFTTNLLDRVGSAAFLAAAERSS